MTNKLSIERIKQYATDPRMCNISDELRSGMVELLAYREAESKPVAVVEISDSFTITQLTGTEPRRKAVRELYEGGLVIGQKLYASPVLSQLESVPKTRIRTDDLVAVPRSLLASLGYVTRKVAGLGESNTYKELKYYQFAPAISHQSASPVLGQTPIDINSELLEALRTMTSLCRTRYGNLDKDVYAEIESAEALIAKATGENQ